MTASTIFDHSREDRTRESDGSARRKRDVSISVGLPHMDVVLSLSANRQAGSMSNLDLADPVVSDIMSSDPVIQHLLEQFDQVRSGEHEDDGVYGDAIRLAMAARWLKLNASEQEPSAVPLQKWRLKRVIDYIEENLSGTISLVDLARVSGLSRMYFAARFRVATGVRPHEYVLRRRVERAKEMLAQTQETLSNIALDVGFQTQSHFTTVFKKFVGTSPGRWRAANYEGDAERLPSATALARGMSRWDASRSAG